MNACNNCLENNWSYKHIDGYIIANCNLCDYEVEFKAIKKKLSLKAGNPCRKCKTPIILRETKRKPSQLKKAYYFTAYYYCPKCRTMYMDNRFRVNN